MKKIYVLIAVFCVTGFVLARTPSIIGGGSQASYTDAYSEASDGRLQCVYFTYSSGTTALSNQCVAVAKIPGYARIVGGEIDIAANLADGATAQIGLIGADGSGYIDKSASVADNYALFASAAASNTWTSGDTFATLSAGDGNANYVTDKSTFVTISTTSTVVWATNVVISGNVKYIDP